MSKELRERREALGRNLDDAAAATRVKKSFLHAIENEEYGKLPIPVYTRGYIREYARYLGIPYDVAIARYNRFLEGGSEESEETLSARPASPPEAAPTAPIPVPAVETKPVPVSTVSHDVHAGPPGISRFISSLSPRTLTVITALLVLVVLYGYYSLTNSTSLPVVPQVVKQEPVPPVAVSPPPAGSPGEAVPQAASPLAGAAPEVGVAAKRAQRHHLEITATETSWVRVVADGIDAKEALLHKGDKIVMDADTLLDILLGNAGGVEMKYNGERLAPGKKGEVLKLTIPEDAPPAPPAAPRKQRMDTTPPTDNTETPAPKPAR